MAQISGRAGMVNIDGDILGMKSWTIDYTVDVLDTTDFADGGTSPHSRTFVPGLSTWSGSFEGYKDGTPTALGTSITTVTLRLEEDASTYFEGEVFITGIHANTAVDGVVTYSYDFQGTGDLDVSNL